MIFLDKTKYKDFLKCERYGWNIFHQKLDQTEEDETNQTRFQAGQEVEELAQNLFDPGWSVKGSNKQSAEMTRKLIQDKNIKVIYQATAISDQKLLAKADIVTVNHQQKTIDIYEVKSTGDLKLIDLDDPKKDLNKLIDNDYLQDVTFQKIAFEDSHYRINKIFLIHINKEYKFKTDIIDVEKLFTIVDITEIVKLIQPQVRQQINHFDQLSKQVSTEPECQCRYKGKSKRCPNFYKFNSDIPINNSIYNIAFINKKTIKNLLDQNIMSLEDFELSKLEQMDLRPKQVNQITAFKTQEITINHAVIKNLLNKIEKPIYFLDYESINYAVPRFKSATPFLQVPFQYSLHILDKSEIALHHEYLMEEASLENLDEMLQNLTKLLKDEGSIVVWHQSAEKSFQGNAIKLLPKYASIIENWNSRLFDLEEVFTSQAYIDPKFEGQTNLKKVTEVLAPKLSYATIQIQSGLEASSKWDRALKETPKNRQEIFKHLLKYCKYDTLTMVTIYQKLKKLIQDND